jgi:hypothetical protein
MPGKKTPQWNAESHAARKSVPRFQCPGKKMQGVLTADVCPKLVLIGVD